MPGFQPYSRQAAEAPSLDGGAVRMDGTPNDLVTWTVKAPSDRYVLIQIVHSKHNEKEQRTSLLNEVSIHNLSNGWVIEGHRRLRGNALPDSSWLYRQLKEHRLIPSVPGLHVNRALKEMMTHILVAWKKARIVANLDVVRRGVKVVEDA